VEEASGNPEVSILNPWPTIVAKCVVPGHEAYDGEIDTLAQEGLDRDVFALDAPGLRWLLDNINAKVSAYFDNFTKLERCSWRVEGRLAVHGPNGFQAMANKPGSYFTGAYFVTVPEKKQGLRLRKDVRSNSMMLVTPRHGMTMASIAGDPYFDVCYQFSGEPGLLLMWPAFINYWMTPNHSDNPLVMVQFDVIIDDDMKDNTWQRLAILAPGGEASSHKEDFLEIWPTKLVQRRIEACEDWNNQLVAHIIDMESTQKNLTTEYRTVEFFSSNKPAVGWLEERIKETVNGYFQNFPSPEFHWGLKGWPSINRIGDYHEPHLHPWCYLSGTYYVQLPKAESGDYLASTPSGAINFSDPRPSASQIAVEGDPYSRPQFSILPEPGTMLLWPSSLLHTVYPNMSPENRISVSFNIGVSQDSP
jgi:uncharacterized protein (TIGR02466 family)